MSPSLKKEILERIGRLPVSQQRLVLELVRARCACDLCRRAARRHFDDSVTGMTE